MRGDRDTTHTIATKSVSASTGRGAQRQLARAAACGAGLPVARTARMMDSACAVGGSGRVIDDLSDASNGDSF